MGHHYEQDGTLIPNVDLPNPYRELPHLKVHETEYLLLHLAAHQEHLTLAVWINRTLRTAAGLENDATYPDDQNRLAHVIEHTPRLSRLVAKERPSETYPGAIEMYYEEDRL